ncbi:MAG: glycogen/starch/alpha-glucan phosphorylase [Oscillospiraceae bacterium]|jgi:starch phosphorylase|nr:glycogen/starch/alpha-glucan phosphorylase [Oscillospiraceae bacterium]
MQTSGAAYGKQELKELLAARLSRFVGVVPEEATNDHFYKALAGILRDDMAQRQVRFAKESEAAGKKKICYLCMEFLMGRSLKNALYNLNLTDTARAALADFGVSLDKLYDQEPDAGLGNGGLGRLAACYLDALATQEIPAAGYSILYEYGIFRQKLVDGWQTELPDFWLPGGKVWLLEREESARTVLFEGTVEESWEGAYHQVEIRNGRKVTAVPFDMVVAGKDGKGVSLLRLWSARSAGLNMDGFNSGNYIEAMEETATAEVISKVLYPADNHPEGKSLRLRQQYFLVSASVQDLIYAHLREYGSLDNLPDRVAVHINDTHPTMAVPELMRILLDECGYGWDDAWSIVTRTFAYTNHTVMKEALECWSEELVQRLLPRIYQIILEIDHRFRWFVWERTQDAEQVERMAIVGGGAPGHGVVRMANLCVAAGHSVNGVSALHSEILQKTVFHDFYTVMPEKFHNVTNGIAHRRWLCQANPKLTALLTELIGGGFAYDGAELEKLTAYADDAGVLEALGNIKRENKRRLAAAVRQQSGVVLDPDSLFDVQVKRLHEYKRQHLNAFQILAQYLAIKENPAAPVVPHTYLFAAKAAPGYFIAKKIISFLVALSELINRDPDVAGRLKVLFLENYTVTLAEALMPAAEISEQISLAGTEASGTGNMKLMLNGAVTLGTLDGANVEIREAVGDDNILLFGLRAEEAARLKGSYEPMEYYRNNSEIARLIDFLNGGIAGKSFPEIWNTIHWDPYMVLADFSDYRFAQQEAARLWTDSRLWNRMSLLNIAGAGRFAADRAVKEYMDTVWN